LWEITDDILQMVQDEDTIAMEDQHENVMWSVEWHEQKQSSCKAHIAAQKGHTEAVQLLRSTRTDISV